MNTVLESLTKQWLDAKAAEMAANVQRLQVEQLMQAELPPPPGNEGMARYVTSSYRVTLQYGIKRKVNVAKLQAQWATLPAKAQECFRWKPEVVVANWRGLAEYMPADYANLAGIVTSEPGKPTVTVERAEEKAAA